MHEKLYFESGMYMYVLLLMRCIALHGCAVHAVQCAAYMYKFNVSSRAPRRDNGHMISDIATCTDSNMTSFDFYKNQ